MSSGHVDTTKTRPLSPDAFATLRSLITDGPRPRQTINPGIVHRLFRGVLVSSVMLPSPFKTHKGAEIEHLAITEAGRSAVAERDRARAAEKAGGTR